jgi:hypothetical protein
MTPPTVRHPLIIVAIALSLSMARHAGASSPVAEQLFQDALALMEASDYGHACPKLEESQKLEARSGTLLNLGYCHEKLGKTATAWVEYRDAAALARGEGRTDNADKATALAAELEPKLSRLRIDVSSSAEAIAVKVDGNAAVTGTPFPIDPGEHVVTASAEGKIEWSTRVTVGANADSKTVAVPELLAADAPPPAGGSVVDAPREEGAGEIPIWAWVAGAGGVVLMGISVGFAVDQTAAGNAIESSCGADRKLCVKGYDFQSDYDREKRDFGVFVGLGVTGVVALGAGIVGIAVGASSAPDGSSTASRVTLGPAAIGVEGTF